MIGSIIRKLYDWIPKRTQNILGKSEILRPMRNLILRPQGVFREISVWIERSYLEYPVSFKFYASLKVASKAKKSGIENTLLRNAITLVKKHKGPSNKAVIFDVGANFGYLSLVWAKSIAQNGRIIAFEPNLNVHNSFKNSIRANNLNSIIELQNFAVGKKEGNIQLFLSSTTSNILRSNIQDEHSTSIEMVSLDAFTKGNGIEHCDLVKIDVDGIELDILRGATHLIKKCKPIFIVETNGDKRILDFFYQYEYQILDMELNPFQIKNQLPANIFCIPKTN
jgi:FkbM family methyltransferase